ncbi:MAG: transporter permease [Actinobacteria bacterium]|nr:transporter permease [Actinomycetota bacterium]MCW3044462.1 transporter permease [Actinomycetota bacterium]
MTRYIVRRLLQMVLVFFGATFLLFAALYLLPGDPTQALGSDRTLAPATVQAIRARYHLDDPVYVQYATYIKDIARGDLGTSIQLRRPVSQIMRDSIPWSVKLALSATAVEIILGIGSGVISAIKRYSFLDTLSTVSTSVLIAIPVFWLGLMLQILFGLKFRGTFLGLPISGVTDGWKSYVLPSITLASAVTAVTARLTRTTMLEVMRQDYVRTASAKGLSRRAVVFKHALRNALIPVVTNIGLDFGTLIGGAILTETVYAWPGVGRQVYFAIIAHDNPVIIGSTIVFVFAFMVVNLIVDISYAVLDPRIRYV